MIGSIEIPVAFLARAQSHLKRTGRPLLYSGRRKGRGLLARRNPASGRWALYAVPENLAGRFSIAELLMRLAECASTAVGDSPRRFHCNGHEIGRIDVCDGLVVVSNALALSCLSFVLHHHAPRPGFYLRLAG